MSEMNVTPFIDVMLVLLVIFMIASPMVQGVQVDLPQTKAVPMTSENKAIIVAIDKAGDIYLQDKVINLDNLNASLLESSNNDSNVRVFVHGDNNLDYGRIVKVMSVIQSGGFSKVALITGNDNT